MILIGIGVIIVTSAQLLVDYDGYYYDGDYDRNLVKNLTTIGGMIGHIGTMTLVIGLLITGFMAQNIGQNTRMGLLIATGLVVGLWLGLRLTYSIYP